MLGEEQLDLVHIILGEAMPKVAAGVETCCFAPVGVWRSDGRVGMDRAVGTVSRSERLLVC